MILFRFALSSPLRLTFLRLHESLGDEARRKQHKQFERASEKEVCSISVNVLHCTLSAEQHFNSFPAELALS